MSEQVIITRDGGVPRILRLAVVVDVYMEQVGARWSVCASLAHGAAPRVLRSGLDEVAASRLWQAFRDWLGHRGGLTFDVEEWERVQGELASAGRSGRTRGVRAVRT